MALIVENGTGVFGANSYGLASEVTTYLTDRNRATENGWTSPEGAEEDAACIEATDYIEQRWRLLFKGVPRWPDLSVARASLTFTGQPTATETVTIGSQVYTFQSSLSSSGDVLIGASVSASIDNLVDAVTANPTNAGTTYHASTPVNADATAHNFDGDILLALAKAEGTPGNAVVSTDTVANASWNFATLVGGSDLAYPQPLSFPRTGLVDRHGIAYLGVPTLVKNAWAEYAVRARLSTTTLAPDPTVDALGGVVAEKFEKVGPIEERTRYVEGSTSGGRLPAYPAADRFLADLVKKRIVVRG